MIVAKAEEAARTVVEVKMAPASMAPIATSLSCGEPASVQRTTT
jgi:hypothetical protein